MFMFDKRCREQVQRFQTGRSLWSSDKGKDLGYHHISGSIYLSCETKLHFLVTLYRYALLFFGPFKYSGDGLSVEYTSYPRVRYVSLIDSDLTLLIY